MPARGVPTSIGGMSTTSLTGQASPAHRRPRRSRRRVATAALAGGLAAGLAMAAPAAAAPWGEDPDPALVPTAEVVDAVTGEVATVAVLAPSAGAPVPVVADAPATTPEAVAAPAVVPSPAGRPSPAPRSLPVTGAASRYELLIAVVATAGGLALRLWVSLARRR